MSVHSSFNTTTKSINVKLLSFLLPIVLLSLTLVAFLSVKTIHQQGEKAHTTKISLVEELIRAELDDLKSNLAKKIQLLASQPDISQVLQDEFSSAQAHQRSVTTLKAMVEQSNSIIEIQLHSSVLLVETKYVRSNNNSYFSPNYVSRLISKAPQHSNHLVDFVWDDTLKQYQMILAQKVIAPSYSSSSLLTPWILFRFSLADIYSQITKISEKHNTSFIIANPNLEPLYKSDSLGEFTLSEKKLRQKELTIQKEEYLVSHSTVSPFVTLHSFTKKGDFYSSFEDIKNLTILMILLSFTLIVITSYYVISCVILKPIKKLQLVVKQVEKEEIQTISYIQNPCEIGQLHNSFAHTMHSLAIAKHQLSEMAYRDALTTLANKSSFNKVLKERLLEPDLHLSCAFIEIANLRVVNQTYGYTVGDEYLIAIGKILTESQTDKDVSVYRIGNNVFAILCINDPLGQRIKTLSRKIILQLITGCHVAKLEISADAYTGIALGKYNDDPLHVFERVNYAKEQALKSPSKYVFFDAILHQQFQRQSNIRKALIPAIKNNVFSINYQAVYNMENREIAGCEALVRWIDPHLGYVSPDEFIPIAEELGLIFDIDLLVAKYVCTYVSTLPIEYARELKFSINASASELGNVHFPSQLISILDSYNINPLNIEIEFTETAFIEINSESQSIVDELRSLGFSIALDDFGTGFTSLNQLVKLNIDKVKIDREHTALLLKKDSSFVDLILNIGERFHFSITAEGIEEESQWLYLQQRGCTFGQGYFMAKPLPQDEFTQLLMASQPIIMSI